MCEKEKLQSELLPCFETVGQELAFKLADYFSDPEYRPVLDSMCEDGALVLIAVKVGRPGKILENETIGDFFETVKPEYLDLVLPVDIGKRFFTGIG